MKYGVIDVGSNSVRLMINIDGKTLYKLVETTRLAENMGGEKLLKAQSVDRTVSAVSFFVNHAKTERVDQIYIFGTAAVRNATNSGEFVKAVKLVTGYEIDVVSGEMEAYLGRLGALKNGDGGIIDVGGASTEITAVVKGKQVYSKSLDLGAVKIKDECGQDYHKSDRLIKQKIEEYGAIPNVKFLGIGGTATSIASMVLQLEPYDPTKTDGFIVDKNQLKILVDKLYSLSIEQREKLKGLQPSRAEVIAGGALLLLRIMDKIGIKSVTVSESDNLEGYLELKRRENEKKN